METTALGFLYGPTLALLVTIVLVAAGRWASGFESRRAGRADSQDFGLLVPVATVPTAEAYQLRAVLRGGGVRATCAPASPSPTLVSWRGEILRRARARSHVLVFAEDAQRAALALARYRRGREPADGDR